MMTCSWKSCGTVATIGLCSVAVSLAAADDRPAAQLAAQRAIADREAVVEFFLTQGRDCRSPDSSDQITILFSNMSAKDPAPPSLVFGEDIIREFSFSAADVRNDKITFLRRVRDRAFLDARYIRIVNAGSDNWCGGTLTLTVDKARLLDGVPIGIRGGTGIMNWNRNNWKARAYWEGSLQSLLRPTKK